MNLTLRHLPSAICLSLALFGCATRPPVIVESQPPESQPPAVPGMPMASKAAPAAPTQAAVIVPSVVVTNYKTLVWTIPGRTGTEACFATWLDEVTATGQIVRAEVVSIPVANPKSPTPQNFTNVVSSTNRFAFWRVGAR